MRRLEPLLAAAERPARYLNHEFGCVYKPEAGFRFCMSDSAAAVPRRSILRVSVQESTETESATRYNILRIFIT